MTILAEHDCCDTTKMIIKEFRANVNTSCKRRTKANGVYYSLNPLFWAAEKGHLEMVKLLLNHGAHKISSIRNVSVLSRYKSTICRVAKRMQRP